MPKTGLRKTSKSSRHVKGALKVSKKNPIRVAAANKAWGTIKARKAAAEAGNVMHLQYDDNKDFHCSICGSKHFSAQLKDSVKVLKCVKCGALESQS